MAVRTLLIAGLLWTAFPAAQSPRAPAADPAPRPFRGRVVTTSGDPLPRARIAVSSEGAAVDVVLTDDRGWFSIPLVRAFDLTLRISKAGHAAERIHVSRKDVLAATSRIIPLEKGAAVSGRVAFEPGRPAVSVAVVVRRVGGDRSAATEQAVGETDDRGEFRIGGLRAGRHIVFAGRSTADAIAVSLKPGDDISGVNLVLDPPPPGEDEDENGGDAAQDVRGGGSAIIRGRVIADSGEPLAGARIRLMRYGVNIRTGAADVNGHYSIDGVPEGRYTLRAATAGYVPIDYGQRRSNELGRLLHVRKGETLRGVEFVLPRGSAVTGNIADEHGEPVEGAVVRALQVRFIADRLVAQSVPGVRERRSDDRGQYRLFGLLPGTYLIAASIDAAVSSTERGKSHGYAPSYYPGTANIADAWPMAVAAERDVHGAHIVLSPSPAVRVSGLVLDQHGKAFKGLMLLAHSRWSRDIATEPRTVPVNGAFLFTNVAPGDYVVQATATPESPDPTEFVAEYARVADRDVSLSLTTSPGAAMRGQVLVEGGIRYDQRDYVITPVAADFDRSPIAGTGPIRVDEPLGLGFIGLHGPTRFVLSGAPPRWYLKRVSINGFDATEVPYDFTYKGAWTADGRIVISPNGATIRGRVVDDQSAPVHEYTVIVYAADREKRFAHSRFTRFGRPSQDDEFEVSGLPPGDYRVAAVPSLDVTDRAGDWQNPVLLETLSARAHRVTVEEGAVVDLTLRPVVTAATRR